MPFDKWDAINLRLSVFLVPTINFIKNITWQEIFGTEPDAESSQSKIGVMEAIREFPEKQILLKISPGRIDLISQPNPNNILTEPLISLGNALQAMEDFKIQTNYVLHKLESISGTQVSRLAFGAELRIAKSDKSGVCRILNQLLEHSVKVDEKSNDFQYSINRRRKSTINTDLEINRLTVWNALRYQLYINNQEIYNDNKFACHLTLDINTVQSEKILPLSNLEAAFIELTKLGIEIAEYGDIE